MYALAVLFYCWLALSTVDTNLQQWSKPMRNYLDTASAHLEYGYKTICATVDYLYLQRYFKQWTGCSARPPTLLEGIDPKCEVQTTWQHVRTCVTKMYKLSTFLNQQPVVSTTNILLLSCCNSNSQIWL
jgi:hypothetical protein